MLSDLPQNAWPRVCAANLDTFTHLPQVNKHLQAVFHDIQLRFKCLQSMLEQAHEAVLHAQVSSQGQENIGDRPVRPGEVELQQRCCLLRLKRYVYALVRRAIFESDLEVLSKCIEILEVDVNHQYEDGATTLQLCILNDFADGAQCILHHPKLELPSATGTPASMVQNLDEGGSPGVVGSLAANFGQTVLQMVESGMQMADFNPVFLGVLYHSLSASSRVISVLRDLPTVMLSGTEQMMTGVEYLRRVIGAKYQICNGITMPYFGCGSAQGRWFSRHQDLAKCIMSSRRHVSILELEMRRADTLPAFVSLILAEGSELLPNDDSSREQLALVIAAKRSVFQHMKTAGDPSAALQAALGTAGEKAGEEAAEQNAVRMAGWFGVNSDREFAEQFEAAAVMAEQAKFANVHTE